MIVPGVNSRERVGEGGEKGAANCGQKRGRVTEGPYDYAGLIERVDLNVQ